MNTKIQKSIVAGIVGTIIMTLVMMVLPMIGMPKMSPPNMLSRMLKAPVFVGWIMHFIIGIIFAIGYTYLCFLKHKIKNIWLKGTVFGIVAFIFAQIMMGIIGAIIPMPKMEGSMMLTMIGSLIGHIIFGIAIAKIIGESYHNNASCEIKAK